MFLFSCSVAKQRCTLYCQSKETRVVVNMQELVEPGSRCSYKDPYSVCVYGECEVSLLAFVCLYVCDWAVLPVAHGIMVYSLFRKWAVRMWWVPHFWRTSAVCVGGTEPGARLTGLTLPSLIRKVGFN